MAFSLFCFKTSSRAAAQGVCGSVGGGGRSLLIYISRQVGKCAFALPVSLWKWFSSTGKKFIECGNKFDKISSIKPNVFQI